MAETNERKKIQLDDVRILFRNFTGLEGDYNAAGDRNFRVCLSDELAKQLQLEGWNVRYLKPRDVDDVPQAILEVSVKYGAFPPDIRIVANGKVTRLTKDTVNLIDSADLERADIIISGYDWTMRGKSGKKAYLDVGYFVVRTNELAKRYGLDTENASGIMPEVADDSNHDLN